MIKPIKIVMTDENIEEILKQQQEQKFKEEYENLELKYCVENLKKYAEYLNEKMNFPIEVSFSIDNGIFGKEIIKIKILEILENEVRQGLKCLYKIANGIEKKINLHEIEIDENDNNYELLEHFKKWYKKNH